MMSLLMMKRKSLEAAVDQGRGDEESAGRDCWGRCPPVYLLRVCGCSECVFLQHAELLETLRMEVLEHQWREEKARVELGTVMADLKAAVRLVDALREGAELQASMLCGWESAFGILCCLDPPKVLVCTGNDKA